MPSVYGASRRGDPMTGKRDHQCGDEAVGVSGGACPHAKRKGGGFPALRVRDAPPHTSHYSLRFEYQGAAFELERDRSTIRLVPRRFAHDARRSKGDTTASQPIVRDVGGRESGQRSLGSGDGIQGWAGWDRQFLPFAKIGAGKNGATPCEGDAAKRRRLGIGPGNGSRDSHGGIGFPINAVRTDPACLAARDEGDAGPYDIVKVLIRIGGA
jgi:hypothetical protein